MTTLTTVIRTKLVNPSVPWVELEALLTSSRSDAAPRETGDQGGTDGTGLCQAKSPQETRSKLQSFVLANGRPRMSEPLPRDIGWRVGCGQASSC